MLNGVGGYVPFLSRVEAEGQEGDAAAAAGTAQQQAGDAVAAAGTAQQQAAVQPAAAAAAVVSRSSSRSSGRPPASVATEGRRNELQGASVPPKAASVLARMCITLGQLMCQDVEWAVACLAEKEVTLSSRSWRWPLRRPLRALGAQTAMCR